MCGTCEPLPSPLMGEGSGGGEDSSSPPHPNLPPPRGEGVLTSPCQPSKGRIQVGHASPRGREGYAGWHLPRQGA
jgi:hypothetical protein